MHTVYQGVTKKFFLAIFLGKDGKKSISYAKQFVNDNFTIAHADAILTKLIRDTGRGTFALGKLFARYKDLNFENVSKIYDFNNSIKVRL